MIGCDSDSYAINKAKIIGSYQLQRSDVEPYFYYLIGGNDSKAYGSLESTVGKIGWNDRYILLWQTDHGLRSGWRVVDSHSKVVSDYLTEEVVKADPNVSDITTMPVNEAWSILK